MTTGHSGNITMEELGRQRFERMNRIIQTKATEIVKEKSGKGPFELTVYGSNGVIVFSTTVKEHDGDFTWTRGNLQEELQTPNAQVVNLRWESEDDGRVFEFANIDLDVDEVKDASSAPPVNETRKPQVAGATD